MKRLLTVLSALILLSMAVMSVTQAATTVDETPGLTDPTIGSSVTPVRSRLWIPVLPPGPVPPPEPGLSLSCGSELIRGCIGDCGNNVHETLSVSREDVVRSLNGKYTAAFCVSQLANNLCPNTSAIYRITNNGEVVAAGDISAGQPALVTGQIGDTIEIDVSLGRGNPDITCILPGQTNFGIGYVRWQ